MGLKWLRGLVAACVGLAMLGSAAAQTPPTATIEKITVHSASVQGNLEGNSADREVFVVLPPSYATAKARRYPVVYFLHGFTSSAQNYMDWLKPAQSIEASVAKGGPEFILVLPDSNTRHGGSMYSNSVTVGDFEGFIARDLVAYIDGHYRTIAKRESRGLAGHSMGGYGTLKIGMKYPQVFSSLYAMSACCLSARTTTVERAKVLETSTMEQALKGEFLTRADFAVSAAWSPAPDKPPFFLDSGLKDGAIDPTVLAKWAANAPNAMVAQYVPALKSYKAIAIDIGDKDFLLSDDTVMHEELKRFGIVHDWTIYQGDHGNRVADRVRDFVIPFFQKNLAGK